MGATETRRVAEFPLFDWLRLAMAMLVAASHFGMVRWGEGGNFGVQVFFALSGWLIGSILIEMRGDKLPLFYFNRATRVWIPYLAALFLLYALSAVRDPITPRWLEFLTYDLTFTHNFFSVLPSVAQAAAEMPLKGTGNHFWSLSVEEQFYLAAPLIILFVPGGRHPLTWVAAAVALIFVRSEFSGIAMGVAAAAMHHRRPGFQSAPAVRVALVATVALGVAVFAGVADHYYFWAVPFVSIAIVMLLAVPGARGPVGRFCGGISYPVYLNHWIALVGVSSVVKRVGGPSAFWGPFGLVLASAIGSAAYLLVDRPVLARRAGWYTPRLGWRLAGLAYALVAIGIVTGLRLRVL